MKRMDVLNVLDSLDRVGIRVLAPGDFAKLFPNETAFSIERSLGRLAADGILINAARGIYVNPRSRRDRAFLLEEIAQKLRPQHMCYLSLESLLSERGRISQIPMVMTVMTTGSPGVHKTTFGEIEFTQTKRSLKDVLESSTVVPGRPLRVATEEAAIRDLRRVGRNTNMLVEDEEFEA